MPSPDANTGGHKGSATVTPDKVRLPSLATVTVYVMVSPDLPTVGTEGDFVTVSWAPAAAVTTTEASPETPVPCGSLAEAVTRFTMDPASMSAWVTV